MPDLKNLAFRFFLRYCYPPHFSASRSIAEQKKVFKKLINRIGNTRLGKDLLLKQVNTYADYQRQIPITQYSYYTPYINRIKAGEKNVMAWGNVRWFAKTAGTGGGPAKLIPVTRRIMRITQTAGTFYSLSRVHHLDKTVDILNTKNFVMTGGIYETLQPSGIVVGDISAIMMKNIPLPFRTIYVPDNDLVTHPSWQYKVDRIARDVSRANVGTISGVPTWHLAVMAKMKEYRPYQHLTEVWKNFRLFFHGGVNFEPYRKHFEELCGRNDFIFFEAYNATEGFFGIQANLKGGDLLLLTNTGIYYEFIPFAQFGQKEPTAVNIEGVQVGIPYVMLISTFNGLLRYVLGDVITFTGTDPFTFRITGRTQEYINAFGEDLLLQNVVNAFMVANQQLGCTVKEYTVAPVYIEVSRKGYIQLAVEFDTPPTNLQQYEALLDTCLQNENPNYAQKRSGNLALTALQVIPVKPGTFYRWMESKGRLGGQNKIPRLVNGRQVIEEVLAVSNSL